MAIERYYLGCPIWGRKDWAGHLYSRDARPADYLAQYARVFNTVEGNTTFYRVPAAETVERWREATPETFRFAFKLPRTITHDLRLEHGAAEQAASFFEVMAPLGPRQGPYMIQLPPSFGPDRLGVLASFLGALPRALAFAVELRHGDFAAGAASAEEADALLREAGADRVWMDTRPLRSGDPDNPDVAAARHKKPDLPVAPVALGHHPVLRFIAYPDLEVSRPWIDHWVPDVARWIRDGRAPYVFIHAANDYHAPIIARALHRRLRRELDVGEMPVWPADAKEEASGQLRLL